MFLFRPTIFVIFNLDSKLRIKIDTYYYQNMIFITIRIKIDIYYYQNFILTKEKKKLEFNNLLLI